jgi:hypothetical protein
MRCPHRHTHTHTHTPVNNACVNCKHITRSTSIPACHMLQHTCGPSSQAVLARSCSCLPTVVADCSPELRTQLATPPPRALRLAADAERDSFAKLPASDAVSLLL